MNVRTASPTLHLALLVASLVILAWSGWAPKERGTWIMEVAPSIVAIAIIAGLYPRWLFTPLVLTFVAIHSAILCVGGNYTYAEVPAFNWLRDEYGLARNYYDRVGHFAQGFVPALVGREILLRNRVLARGPWLFVLLTGTCLGVSACYEFIEWWAALALGQGADAFLGTQGDPWDTQWDMFMALVGAIVAQLTLARLHDRQLGASGEHGNS